MGKYKYLVIHCTATPENMPVSAGLIEQWHKGPRDLKDGGVRYMGKNYASRDALPDDFINGVSVKDIEGRGWSQVGYSKMVGLHGEVTELVPYDGDDVIEGYEITNGVKGINSVSRHFVYVGGLSGIGRKPKDTRTQAQLIMLQKLIFKELKNHPDIQVAGHNSFARKACPSFNVAEFCEGIGVPEKNIYRKA